MNRFHWPLVLTHGDVTLRPIEVGDESAWRELRVRNGQWLTAWEATNPEGSERLLDFRRHTRMQRKDARHGRGLPMVIQFEDRFAGQVTLGNVVWGSFRSGYIGYWIDQRLAGRGITTTAVAMLCDYAFRGAELHRIEINIRPENAASLRLVEKLGFKEEGFRRRYLHIAGDWRDHRGFSMIADELPVGGLLATRPTRH